MTQTQYVLAKIGMIAIFILVMGVMLVGAWHLLTPVGWHFV